MEFESGESIILPRSVIAQEGIEIGHAGTPEEVTTRIRGLEESAARERALRMLNRRDFTRHEFAASLSADGFGERTISDLAQRFLELGLLDDERFARNYARARAASGRGRRLIERELNSRGVDGDTATAAIAGASELDELSRAVAALRGSIPSDRRDRERVLRHLVTRGFDIHTAMEALDSIMQDAHT